MQVERIAAFSYEGEGGNPAGVLVTNEMLHEEKMQAIAKEVNYSETAFLSKHEKGFRIRYFSPETEIAFCGHATIASGAVLAKEFGLGEYELVLNDGSVVINTSKKEGKDVTSIRSVPTQTKEVEETFIKEALALFNFNQEDLNPNYPVKIAFSGNWHLILCVNKKELLEKMAYDFEAAQAWMRKESITTISVLFTEDNTLFHSRNPFAFGGVYEDPATGSAAIALAEYLRSTGLKEEGQIEILQGFDMKQPSRLFASFSKEPNSSVEIYGESRVIN